MEGSTLTVDVEEAKNLAAKDVTGTSDPYVVVSIENNRQSTKSIPNTINPVWKETLTL